VQLLIFSADLDQLDCISEALTFLSGHDYWAALINGS
jgi:hypothetical protein